MNRYFLIRRLTGPAVLVLLGVVALLHQANLVRFSIFVPLLLILIGVIKLVQRAILTSEPYPPAPYPGGAYPGSMYSLSPYPGASTPAAPTQDFGNDPEGGK